MKIHEYASEIISITYNRIKGIYLRFNTLTATDDCSRFYRSLPPTAVVVLRVYPYVPGYRRKVLMVGKYIVYQIFERKKPFSVKYDMRIYLKY